MPKSQSRTETIVSTVRALEDLGYDYAVTGPIRNKKGGNQYRRRMTVHLDDGGVVAFYVPDSPDGRIFASGKNGSVPGVRRIEDLLEHLKKLRRG